MSHKTDWVPNSRVLKLSMANEWLMILDYSKVAMWNIPQMEVDELRILYQKAEEILASAMSKERGSETVTFQCNVAFKALVEKMRFFKSHYYLVPPLGDDDLISLGLTPHSTARKNIPPPIDQAVGKVIYLGEHLLEVHMEPANTATVDPHRSDYGFRIYWGILPPPGTKPEDIHVGKQELTSVPVSGDDLPHSRFTRRKKEIFDFPQEDRGKTVYFCIRYENAKGEPGPWGPIFSAIIP
ncbi:MAG: hypothetical protein LBK82_04195 [Planctomycetaceae bacterium]|jgi:hypothetical protein|nr:hypothetical protein [Planctomycetaceae bacterium]